MKHKVRILTFLLMSMLAVMLAACSGTEGVSENATLTVVAGENEQSYTRAELEELGAATVDAEGNSYVGVPLSTLLEDAGIDAAGAGTVSAVASDGFSASYEPEMVLDPETIVAYATSDGDLAGDEQPFRMVLPDQPGRMNVRMLARIEIGS